MRTSGNGARRGCGLQRAARHSRAWRSPSAHLLALGRRARPAAVDEQRVGARVLPHHARQDTRRDVGLSARADGLSLHTVKNTRVVA